MAARRVAPRVWRLACVTKLQTAHFTDCAPYAYLPRAPAVSAQRRARTRTRTWRAHMSVMLQPPQLTCAIWFAASVASRAHASAFASATARAASSRVCAPCIARLTVLHTEHCTLEAPLMYISSVRQPPHSSCAISVPAQAAQARVSGAPRRVRAPRGRRTGRRHRRDAIALRHADRQARVSGAPRQRVLARGGTNDRRTHQCAAHVRRALRAAHATVRTLRPPRVPLARAAAGVCSAQARAHLRVEQQRAAAGAYDLALRRPTACAKGGVGFSTSANFAGGGAMRRALRRHSGSQQRPAALRVGALQNAATRASPKRVRASSEHVNTHSSHAACELLAGTRARDGCWCARAGCSDDGGSAHE